MQTQKSESLHYPKITFKRASHKNSRFGCVNCKERRRKCDEAKPVCSKCATFRNLTKCEYLTHPRPLFTTEFASNSAAETKQAANTNSVSKPPAPIHASASSPATESLVRLAPSSILSTHIQHPYARYLYHHFVTITGDTVIDLTEVRAGSSLLPLSSLLLTTEYPFLEHAQLGMAALHMLHLHSRDKISSNCPQHGHQHSHRGIIINCNPTEVRRLERAAIYHKVEALRGFRERFYLSGTLKQFGLVSPDSKTQTDIGVAIMCSLIFCVLGLFDNFRSSYELPPPSSLECFPPFLPQKQLHSFARSWLVRWFSLYSGVRSLGFKFVFKLSHACNERAPPRSIPFTFHQRHFTVWGILPKQLIPLTSQLMNRELSEEGITINIKREEVLQMLMLPIHAAITEEINRMAIEDIYTILDALFGLSAMYRMIQSGTVNREEIIMYFIAFPILMEERFLHLVIRKNQVALVTFVHISALLGVLFSGDHSRNCKAADSWFHRWWLNGCSPEKLKEETEEFLGHLDQRWQDLVSWVTEVHKMAWQNKDPFVNEHHHLEHEMEEFSLDDLAEFVGATCVKVHKLYTPAEDHRYRQISTQFSPATGLGRLLADVSQKLMEPV